MKLRVAIVSLLFFVGACDEPPAKKSSSDAHSDVTILPISPRTPIVDPPVLLDPPMQPTEVLTRALLISNAQQLERAGDFPPAFVKWLMGKEAASGTAMANWRPALPTKDEKRLAQRELNELLSTGTSPRLNAKQKAGIAALLLGMYGDYTGSPYEFAPFTGMPVPKSYKNKFNLKNGQWTDDFSMALCLAASLDMNQTIHPQAATLNPAITRLLFLAWWNFGFLNASFVPPSFDGGATFAHANAHSWGLGGNISNSFRALLSWNDTAWTSARDPNGLDDGNGGLMRLSPVAIYFASEELEEAAHEAAQQSRLTHFGSQAADASRLMAAILWMGINGTPKDKVLNDLGLAATIAAIGLHDPHVIALAKSTVYQRENWDWKSDRYSYPASRVAANPGYIGAYSLDALAMSLHMLSHAHNAHEAINAISTIAGLGGDSDSVAAVLGQLVGSFYGAPALAIVGTDAAIERYKKAEPNIIPAPERLTSILRALETYDDGYIAYLALKMVSRLGDGPH